jgi:hypothetical protein
MAARVVLHHTKAAAACHASGQQARRATSTHTYNPQCRDVPLTPHIEDAGPLPSHQNNPSHQDKRCAGPRQRNQREEPPSKKGSLPPPPNAPAHQEGWCAAPHISHARPIQPLLVTTCRAAPPPPRPLSPLAPTAPLTRKGGVLAPTMLPQGLQNPPPAMLRHCPPLPPSSPLSPHAPAHQEGRCAAPHISHTRPVQRVLVTTCRAAPPLSPVSLTGKAGVLPPTSLSQS